MGLLDFLFGRPKRRRSPARRAAPARRRSTSSSRRKVDDDTRRRREDAARTREARHQQALADQLRRADERKQVREQLAWERKRERERQSAERHQRTQKVVQAHKSVRSELAGEPRPPATERTEMARKFAKLHGGTVESWEEILSRSGVSRVKKNPRSRNPASRSALSAAAGALATGGRGRNPFLAEMGTGVLSNLVGWEIIRKVHPGDLGHKSPSDAPQRMRSNPAVAVPGHPDEQLQRMSERFHGERGHILRLEADQRRALPEYVVDVGEEVATVYRPPRSSQRGGSSWEHEAGDQGDARPKATGRRRVVADSSGRTYVVPGTSRMRFSEEQGLIG